MSHHHHGADCGHHDHQPRSGRVLFGIAAFFGLFATAEVTVGFATDSHAIPVDGVHNLLDAVGFYLLGVADRLSQYDEYSTRRCFWAPFLPLVVAASTALATFVQGINVLPEFAHPHVEHLILGIGVAAWSLALNCVSLAFLHQHHHHGHDEGSRWNAFAHLISDIGAAGLTLGGLALISLTGAHIWDPIAGILAASLVVGINIFAAKRQWPAVEAHFDIHHDHGEDPSPDTHQPLRVVGG